MRQTKKQIRLLPDIVSLRSENLSFANIGKALGVSEHFCKKTMVNAGLDVPKLKGTLIKPPKLTAEQKECLPRIIILMDEGYSILQVSIELKRSFVFVRSALLKAKILEDPEDLWREMNKRVDKKKGIIV